MIHVAISVYDNKAQMFTKPFFVPALGVALRSFTEAVNDPSSEYSKYPDDYTLYHIGTYDDSSATLNSIVPVELVKASSVKNITSVQPN